MKKIISFILGAVVALNLTLSVANAAAKSVRVAFFIEWPTPNQEDKVKKMFDKTLTIFCIHPSFFKSFVMLSPLD